MLHSLMKFLLPKKGSVLVFSLIILAFMLVSALSVAVISVTEKRASLATDKSNRSFQVADTGVETMLQKIYKESPQPVDLTALASSAGATCNITTNEIEDSVGSGTYVVSFLDRDGDKIPCNSPTWRNDVAKIKSEGAAGNTKRAVEVAIAAVGDFTLSCATTANSSSIICCKMDTSSGSTECQMYSGTSSSGPWSPIPNIPW